MKLMIHNNNETTNEATNFKFNCMAALTQLTKIGKCLEKKGKTFFNLIALIQFVWKHLTYKYSECGANVWPMAGGKTVDL